MPATQSAGSPDRLAVARSRDETAGGRARSRAAYPRRAGCFPACQASLAWTGRSSPRSLTLRGRCRRHRRGDHLRPVRRHRTGTCRRHSGHAPRPWRHGRHRLAGRGCGRRRIRLDRPAGLPHHRRGRSRRILGHAVGLAGPPPHDLGGALCAAIAFAAGTTIITVRAERDHTAR